eukprot:gene9360-11494_t
MGSNESNYIKEIWIGETDVQQPLLNAVDEVIKVLYFKDDLLQSFLEEINNNEKQSNNINSIHLTKKLRNLKEAVIQILYSNNINPQPQPLNIEIIKNLHKVKGKDIIVDCGEFRTVEVRPSNSVFRYCTHKSIERHLTTLVQFTNDTIAEISKEQNQEIRTKKALLLGTVFFSEFLYLHPFSNGNGRVARILLSRLMKPFTKVTISLYWKDRQTYIDAIESRNDRFVKPPNILATFLLLCASRSF